MDSFRCPLHSNTSASSPNECYCYHRVSPEPLVLRDEFLCACDSNSTAPDTCFSFYADPFHFVGQPNLDGNPLGRTVAWQCSSIFPELSADNAFAFPPPVQPLVAEKAPALIPPSSQAPILPSPITTTDSYTQTTGGAITADLRIPVPLISLECYSKPAFLLWRSGPVTTSVHHIPYNSPCSRSRTLLKITAFPMCPSCVCIQAIFAERPPRPSYWTPLPDATSRTLTYFCIHSNGKCHFQKIDLAPTSSRASYLTHQ